MTLRRRLLTDLAAEVAGSEVRGEAWVSGIAYDSRRVKSGDIFVAIPGLKSDGASFVSEAASRGASAIMAEQSHGFPAEILVPSARRGMAEISWAFYDHPERSLTLCTVTGTNGKTTVASIFCQVLDACGRKCGLVGTLGIAYDGLMDDSARTTPESADLAYHFDQMLARGMTHVVMEATSIGIDLERVWKLPNRVCMFTNLTRDHLDYHGTGDRYREAKLRLFREQPAFGTAVINRDDPSSEFFVRAATGEILTYGFGLGCDFRAENINLRPGGTEFTLSSPGSRDKVAVPLIGQFNVSNTLAVIAAAHALDIELSEIIRQLSRITPARGRAETVASSAPFTVVIDYAHTPDALEKILRTLNDLKRGRLITVIGAGGDRDKGKRPMMGTIASKLSDKVYLTSDNPRNEDPERIIDEIESGMIPGSAYARASNRRNAIISALEEVESEGVVVIAGKGHETYQEISGVRLPFDDREIVREWLTSQGYTN